MSNIIPFAFEDHLVRVTDKTGAPWFVAADVCRALNIRQPTRAVEPLDNDEKGVTSIHTPGGVQEMLIVSESGLYTLILRSRQATTPGTLPHRFRKWVTAEVLPNLRKTGSYQTDRAANLKAEMANLNATSRAMREIRLTLGPIKAAKAAPALLAKIGVSVNAENADVFRQGEFSFNASA